MTRHGRTCSGHLRLCFGAHVKTWIPGTRVYTWARQRRDPSAGHDGAKAEVSRRPSIVLQQPLDVIELVLRPGKVAEPFAQFLDNAARPLHVDLAGDFHRRVVAVIAAAQRPAK